jgi:hypothetical protein
VKELFSFVLSSSTFVIRLEEAIADSENGGNSKQERLFAESIEGRDCADKATSSFRIEIKPVTDCHRSTRSLCLKNDHLPFG